MSSEQPLKFRIAREEWEFEAIHRLNYKTFVEEIPQHRHNAEQRLVDNLRQFRYRCEIGQQRHVRNIGDYQIPARTIERGGGLAMKSSEGADRCWVASKENREESVIASHVEDCR